MNRSEPVEDWVLEDLSAITGKDIKELRRAKPKPKETKGSKANKHKYYRRPGKRHNNDFCSACGDEGSLICCDGCPHSFHLICLNPPMDDEDIPDGEWFCNACQVANKRGPDMKKLFPARFKAVKRRRGAPQDSEAAGIRDIFNVLIKMAIESNPSEYENPKELRSVPYTFPGERKDSKLLKKKLPYNVRCAICKVGLTKQAMVECDYCDRVFHLDCTEPPLTSPPLTYWMCHFHLEPMVENILYKEFEPSLSQRVAVWDFCRMPIDHEAVKLEFLRNLAKDKSPFPLLPTIPADIPEAVCMHYKFPSDQVPSLKAALRVAGFEQSLESIKKMSSLARIVKNERVANSSELTIEQELWLSSIIGFQLEATRALTKSLEGKRTQDDTDAASTSAAQDTPMDTEDQATTETKMDYESSSYARADSFMDNEYQNATINQLMGHIIESIPAGGIEALDHVDPALVKLLAYQRLCQLRKHNKMVCQVLEEGSCLLNSNSSSVFTNSSEPAPSTSVGTRSTEDYEGEKLNPAGSNLCLRDGDSFFQVSSEEFKDFIDQELTTLNFIKSFGTPTAEVLLTSGEVLSTPEVVLSTSKASPSLSKAVPSTSKAVLSSPEVVPSTSKAFLSSSEAVPLTPEVVPSTSKAFPLSSEAVPSTSKAVPSTSKVFLTSTSKAVPSTPKVVPTTSKVVLLTSKVSPSTSKAVPSTSKAVPSISKVVPSTSKAVPSTSKAVPSTSKAVPSTSRAVPSTSKAVPSTSKAIPSTSRAVPSPSRAVPSTSRAVPSTSRAVPSTSRAVPSTYAAVPSTSRAVPSTSTAVPSTSWAVPSTSWAMPSTSWADFSPPSAYGLPYSGDPSTSFDEPSCSYSIPEDDSEEFPSVSQNEPSYRLPEPTTALSERNQKVEALLVCISTNRLFPIKKGGCTVGRGVSCSVDLTLCGFCNFISDRHADIFYDATSEKWELLNYSSFGSTVDNIFVSNDIPKKKPAEELKNCCVIDSAKRIIRAHIFERENDRNSKTKNRSKNVFTNAPCYCNLEELLEKLEYSGWNNSVVLNHGTYLQFGCHKLVFADVRAVQMDN